MRKAIVATLFATGLSVPLAAQTFVSSIDISTEISASTGVHTGHIAVDDTGATPIIYVNPLNNGAAGQTLNIVKIADPLGTPAVSTFATNDAGGAGVSATRGSGGIAVDGAGNVFICWTGNGGDDSARIQRYSSAGGAPTGEWLYSAGLSDRLGGIDVNAAGDKVVGARFLSTATQTGHYELTGAATLTRTFAATPAGAVAQNPRNVAFDATNSRVYINANGALSVINADTPPADAAPATKWAAGTAATLQDTGANSFAGHGVDVNADGSLIVYSPNQNVGSAGRTMRIVDPAGSTLLTIGELDSPGDGTGALLSRGSDAAFFTASGKDYVAVADYELNTFSRVAIYELPTPISLRTVDGVGVASGTFASIAEAVADLAASPEATDGGLDIINVTADTVESTNVLIDHSVITDEVQVRGNGNTAVFQATAITDGVGINIKADNASKTTLADLTVVPEDDPSTGTVAFAGAAIRVKDQDVATTGGFTVALSGVTITSSTAGNAVVDPDAAAPEDSTNWVFGGSPIYAGGIRVDSTSGGADNVVTISDTKISHTGSRGLYVAVSDGTSLTTTNVEAKYNAGVGLRTFSLTGSWTLIDCVSSNNADSGFATAGTGTATSAVTISGGEFSNNSFYGMQLDGLAAYSINGTDGDPIRIVGNGNRGVRFSNAGSVIDGLSYLVIADNASHGFDVNELDTDASWTNGINEVIFSGNGTISATPTNMSYGDTHSTAKTIEVTNVTFYNPSGAQAAGWDAFNFQYRYGSDLTWNFTDCIFAGNAGDNDYAVGISGTGANRVVNITNSAIVTAGPALAGVSAGTGTGLTINQTAVINDDPNFLDPGDVTSVDFLNVQNPAFGGAGSAASDLSGGADYVPDFSDVSDWMILND
ncbi:MAG: hypothetical protein PWP23_3319 [Candidatus Sumerlaeota bacterium]|nr:hypothetical protein [Candidatus Sumerlaeota bacterium]